MTPGDDDRLWLTTSHERRNLDNRLNLVDGAWPKLEHGIRHECGYVVSRQACPKCLTAWDYKSYEDIWIWE